MCATWAYRAGTVTTLRSPYPAVRLRLWRFTPKVGTSNSLGRAAGAFDRVADDQPEGQLHVPLNNDRRSPIQATQ